MLTVFIDVGDKGAQDIDIDIGGARNEIPSPFIPPWKPRIGEWPRPSYTKGHFRRENVIISRGAMWVNVFERQQKRRYCCDWRSSTY